MYLFPVSFYLFHFILISENGFNWIQKAFFFFQIHFNHFYFMTIFSLYDFTKQKTIHFVNVDQNILSENIIIIIRMKMLMADQKWKSAKLNRLEKIGGIFRIFVCTTTNRQPISNYGRFFPNHLFVWLKMKIDQTGTENGSFFLFG